MPKKQEKKPKVSKKLSVDESVDKLKRLKMLEAMGGTKPIKLEIEGLVELAEAIREQTTLHREMWDEVKPFVVFAKMALDIGKDELLAELTEKFANAKKQGPSGVEIAPPAAPPPTTPLEPVDTNAIKSSPEQKPQ